MKQVHLVTYFDPEDNYKGTICVSENEPRQMSQECVDAIKAWFTCDESIPFDEDEFREVIEGLRQNGYYQGSVYEFLIEESYLY